MLDLTKRWPFWLDRQNWPFVAGAIAIILAGLMFIDVWASRGAIAWIAPWRAPFFMVTDYGLSDWILLPTLTAFFLARIAMLFLKRLSRMVAFEIAMLSGFIFCGVAIPGLIANLIKRIVGRGRPDEFEQVGAFAFQHAINDWTFQSFPSGHSTTAIAFAFVMGFLVPRTFPVLLTIGLIAAFSRIPVGMHYPSDVFAGFVVGTLGAYGVRNLFASRNWLFCQQVDGCIVRKSLPGLKRLFQRRRA